MALETLKTIMQQKGITPYEMQFAAKITQGDMSKILNGRKKCYPAWRKRIAKVLKMPEYIVFPEYNSKKEA